MPLLHAEEVGGSNATIAHSSGLPALNFACRLISPDPMDFWGRELVTIRSLSWFADAGDGDVFMVFSLICNHAEEG